MSEQRSRWTEAVAPCPASTVFEIIGEREATAAGISARFQCQDCGEILGREDEPHRPRTDS